MRFTRVSIGQLMVLVVLIALASVALIRPTRLGASMVFAAMVLALTVATLAAKFGRVESRASCAGFAVGGWICMVVHFSPLNTSPSGLEPWKNGPLLNPPSTALLDFLYPRLVKEPNMPVFVPSPLPPGSTYGMPTSVDVPVFPELALGPDGIAGPTPDASVSQLSGSASTALPSLPAPPIAVPPPPLEPWSTYWTEIDRGSPSLVLERSPSFLTIGYALSCLLFATLTSIIASWLHRSARSQAVEPARA